MTLIEPLLMLSAASLFLVSTLKSAAANQSIVIFKGGRPSCARNGPCKIIVLPLVQRVEKVDVGVQFVELLPIRDSTSLADIQVKGTVSFRIIDPVKFLSNGRAAKGEVSLIVRSALLVVLQTITLDQISSGKTEFGKLIAERAAKRTSLIGIELISVSVTDVPLLRELVRLLAAVVRNSIPDIF